MTQRKAMELALEALETLTQYNMVRANIFRRFEPTCTGDYVDLREFREKAKPVITAIKEALAQQSSSVSNKQVEPVAYRYMDINEPELGFWFDEEQSDVSYLQCEPLYTTPYVATPRPQRKPLTDEQIDALYEQHVANCWDSIEDQRDDPVRIMARAIEAAHGIKEQK